MAVDFTLMATLERFKKRIIPRIRELTKGKELREWLKERTETGEIVDVMAALEEACRQPFGGSDANPPEFSLKALETVAAASCLMLSIWEFENNYCAIINGSCIEAQCGYCPYEEEA